MFFRSICATALAFAATVLTVSPAIAQGETFASYLDAVAQKARGEGVRQSTIDRVFPVLRRMSVCLRWTVTMSRPAPASIQPPGFPGCRAI